MVAAPFSMEQKTAKDTWWVNFKSDTQEVAVLCELTRMNADAIQVINLPRAFIDKYRQHLPVGDDGLVQMSFKKRDGKFFAQITSIDPVDVTEFIDKELLICPRSEYE